MFDRKKLRENHGIPLSSGEQKVDMNPREITSNKNLKDQNIPKAIHWMQENTQVRSTVNHYIPFDVFDQLAPQYTPEHCHLQHLKRPSSENHLPNSP